MNFGGQITCVSCVWAWSGLQKKHLSGDGRIFFRENVSVGCIFCEHVLSMNLVTVLDAKLLFFSEMCNVGGFGGDHRTSPT